MKKIHLSCLLYGSQWDQNLVRISIFNTVNLYRATGSAWCVQLSMTKPIVYRSFEEKAVLEKKLARHVSKNDVNKASIALMNIFYMAGKKRRAKKTLKSK
jgi:hypothetical protein